MDGGGSRRNPSQDVTCHPEVPHLCVRLGHKCWGLVPESRESVSRGAASVLGRWAGRRDAQKQLREEVVLP